MTIDKNKSCVNGHRKVSVNNNFFEIFLTIFVFFTILFHFFQLYKHSLVFFWLFLKVFLFFLAP